MGFGGYGWRQPKPVNAVAVPCLAARTTDDPVEWANGCPRIAK
jgi:hypothetical protein